MRKHLANLLLGGTLLASLAGCGDAVEVTFEAPFPAGSANLPQFRPHDQGRYYDAADTAATLVVSASNVVRQVQLSLRATGHQLDSMQVPRQAGSWPRQGQQYRVTPLAVNLYRLNWLQADTLVTLRGRQPDQLRRHRGWYYLSSSGTGQLGTWQVSRLRVAGRQLLWQQLTTDTLRLRALDADAWRVRREPGLVQLTLNPQQRRAIRQLSGYEGLWLAPAQYVRVSRQAGS